MTLDTLQLAPGWLVVEVDPDEETKVRLTSRGQMKCCTGRVVREHRRNPTEPLYLGPILFEPATIGAASVPGWRLEVDGKPYTVIHERQIIATLSA